MARNYRENASPRPLSLSLSRFSLPPPTTIPFFLSFPQPRARARTRLRLPKDVALHDQSVISIALPARRNDLY